MKTNKTVDVVSALISKNGKILSVKRSVKNKYFPGMLVFPGGKRENNESIFETAIREIKEETGFDIKIVDTKPYFLGTITRDGVLAKFYLCNAEITGGELRVENDEVEELLWVEPNVLLDSLKDHRFYKSHIKETIKVLKDKGVI